MSESRIREIRTLGWIRRGMGTDDPEGTWRNGPTDRVAPAEALLLRSAPLLDSAASLFR
ncbi:hypothetical protein MPNT_510003 [Candidatus Methylacidithermus pantelleriae]|uniref:Uncharacterized protein n=1 Tax=Candidatus Methylacidithermus pantelleriae TaxID=2744239 RepID=A0A8J2BQV8_9BACT|nr:hypothetical protein MPNT_510003 [Candidatus Methylacidithermus pantelleriae]